MTQPIGADDAVGTVQKALSVALGLLDRDPSRAAEQAREILLVVPGHPQALMILAGSQRRLGDLPAASAVLAPLARAQANAPSVHYEWGLTLAGLGDANGAISALRYAVHLAPAYPDAWRALGDVWSLAGDAQAADAAYAQAIRASVNDPTLMAAAVALCDKDLLLAERLLRKHLQTAPTDAAAIRMLAETGLRLGRFAQAEILLRRCLALTPSFSGARHSFVVALFRQKKAAEAIPHIEALLAERPREPVYRNLLAACLAMIGDSERAIVIYEDLINDYTNQPKIWLSYGHALRAAGKRRETVAAYRTSIALAPSVGEAYWSLANLKNEPFTPDDLVAMRTQLARADITEEDRLHLDYALGRALEETGEYEASFAHYAAGAARRRAEISYSADETSDLVARSMAFFSPALFAARAGQGCPDDAPIFVVGLPRSGSTLIEQILSSHSTVEGTMELPELAAMARRLGSVGDEGQADARYPAQLAALHGGDLAALGREFLDRAKTYRKLNRAFFIDKMPNNWAHVGLIHLILPNAKIIDARRHPMATCFSAFKQHFARGQHFSYDLTELGRYYRDYVKLMAHFDAVLPGRVHRVIYENMVADTDAETRRLLAYCGLDFEPACLRFWETDRSVRTASSEQVRTPIFQEGLDQWRHYAGWLGTLHAALGEEETSFSGWEETKRLL